MCIKAPLLHIVLVLDDQLTSLCQVGKNQERKILKILPCFLFLYAFHFPPSAWETLKKCENMVLILVFVVVDITGKNAYAISVLRRVEMKLDGRDIADNR